MGVQAEFKKLKGKKFGLPLFQDVKSREKFVFDAKSGEMEQITGKKRGRILHVKKVPKGVKKVFEIPFSGRPVYALEVKEKDYPLAFIGTAVASYPVIMPLVEQLIAVNPPLGYALATSPALLGIVAEKVVRGKVGKEVLKDVKKFEKFVEKEYSVAKKKLKKVI